MEESVCDNAINDDDEKMASRTPELKGVRGAEKRERRERDREREREREMLQLTMRSVFTRSWRAGYRVKGKREGEQKSTGRGTGRGRANRG